jgi:hypothetical protein
MNKIMENETNLSTIDNLEKTLIEKFVKTCILCRGSGLQFHIVRMTRNLRKYFGQIILKLVVYVVIVVIGLIFCDIKH